jgi:hypothetical protein
MEETRATPIDQNDPALQPFIPPTLPLAGKKPLVVGIAGQDSILHGCARASEAEVAITYPREKLVRIHSLWLTPCKSPPSSCRAKDANQIILDAVFDCYGLRP